MIVDWDADVHGSRADAEIAQGRALADAAVANNVELYIWSSLPRTGRPHFDSKAVVEEYVRELPLTSAFYMPGFYMQNFLLHLRPTRRPDGSYVVTKPWPHATSASVLPLIDIDDTGNYIAPFLAEPARYKHARLWAAAGFYSLAEICRVWMDVTGTKVVFDEASGVLEGSALTEAQNEALRKDDRAREEIGYYGPGGEDGVKWTVEQVGRVGERLTTWPEFVKANEPWFE